MAVFRFDANVFHLLRKRHINEFGYAIVPVPASFSGQAVLHINPTLLVLVELAECRMFEMIFAWPVIASSYVRQ